ncbi:MAG: lipase family protein [Gordonia sp. (in: high G+C Gram-positive bacteria)]
MIVMIPTPARDPFYLPPADLAVRTPGEVLGSRRVRLAALGVLPLRVSAWQLQHRTNNLDGLPEAGVTTVIEPSGRRSRGVLSFQCAIDAVSQRCLPSYALRYGASAAGALAQIELPLILAAVREGWTVSIPDHGGLDGRFGAAREPGYRALDGVRAALDFTGPPDGEAADTPVALWGYSGGGLATVWGAEVAGDYAPELSVIGSVAGAPVGDPAKAFLRLNGGPFAGFPAIFVAGLRRAYPDLNPVLDKHVHAGFQERIVDAEQRTTLSLLARFAGRDIRRSLHFDMPALLAEPELARVLRDIRPGSTAPSAPLLIQQGSRDEVIDVADIDALVDRYRSVGADVDYQLVPHGWHLPLQFWTARSALTWLSDRLPAPTAPALETSTGA